MMLYSVTWEEAVTFVRSITSLPLLLKGVLSPGDAVKAAQLGCEVSLQGELQDVLQYHSPIRIVTGIVCAV